MQKVDAIFADQPHSSRRLFPVLTFTVRHVSPEGVREDVIRRTMICPRSQRAKFERRRGKTLVEQIEIEATWPEDTPAVELNAAVECRVDGTHLKGAAEAILRVDDPDGQLLFSVPGKTVRESYEVL